MYQKIGFTEPVRMLGEKRSFLWACSAGMKSTSVSPCLKGDARRTGGTKPRRAPLAARTSGVVRSDDTEQLLAHGPRLTQTSLPTYSFTSVGNYGLAFLLLVSPPSVPAYPVTSVTSGHDICRLTA